MKLKGKRLLSWLMTVVMVLSMLPTTALAAEVGETETTKTEIPPENVANAVWVLNESTILAPNPKTDCEKIEHSHDDSCYTKNCDHADATLNGHFQSCYGGEWVVCKHEEGDDTAHTGAFTVDSSIKDTYDEINSELWSAIKAYCGITASSGLELVLQLYKLKEAYGVTFCYTIDYNNLSCTHVCSEIGGECYETSILKGCPGYEHTHDASENGCYVYSWTLYADVNNNGTADETDTYTVVYKDGEKVLQSTSDLAYGAETPTIVDPSREDDYVFAGWSPERADTVTAPTEGNTITYTATWKPDVDTNEDGIPDGQQSNTIEVTCANAAVTVNGKSVASGGSVTIPMNSTATVTFTANENCYMTGVTVDGEEVDYTSGSIEIKTGVSKTYQVSVTAAAKEATEVNIKPDVKIDYYGTAITAGDVLEEALVSVTAGETVVTTDPDDVEIVESKLITSYTSYTISKWSDTIGLWIPVGTSIGGSNVTIGELEDTYKITVYYAGSEKYNASEKVDIEFELVDGRKDASLVLKDATIEITNLSNATVSADKIKEALYVSSEGNGAVSITSIGKYSETTDTYIPVYSSLISFGSTDLTEFGKYQVTMELAETAQYKSTSATAYLTIVDARTPTNIVLKENVTLTYSETLTKEDIYNAVEATLMSNGQEIDGELTYTVSGTNAGTQTVEVKYAGSDTYAASSNTVEVTINKAPVELSVDVEKNVVKYGEAYNATTSVDPQQVSTIQFVLGLNVNDVQIQDESLVGWATELNLILPGTIGKLLNQYIPEEGISSSDLLTALNGAKTLLVGAGMSEETLNGVISTIEQMQEQFGTLTIKLNADMPTDIGLYLIGAVTADPNYETKLAVNYVAITPDGYKAELDWKIPDANGIITLPVIQDGTYDLSAYVTKVYEGSVEEAEKELVNLFLGVDVDGNIIVTKDQKELAAGAYTEISYILNWGNTMYYAMPIARAFVVTPQLVDVKFIDGSGNANNDRTFTFDGEHKVMDVAVNGVKTVPGGSLSVTYYGVRSNGETYNSTTAPSHAGVYTAVAIYTERDSAGEVVKMGADVGAMLIQPAEAIIAVDNAHHIYDGMAYDVMQLVKSTPADAKVALFTCGIKLDGDFSEEGLSALEGQANIDLPAAADAVMKQYLPDVYADGLSAAAVAAKIPQVQTKLEELGLNAQTLEGLTDLLEQLPADMILTFKDQSEVNPAAVGAYLVVGMIFDPDYIPELGAGVLVITPEMQKTYLQFNCQDDNGIFTYHKLASADMNASAYDDAAFAVKNADATALMENLFLGVDEEGKLTVTADATALRSGVYIQLAYIGEINGRYYADPISRPMIVAPAAADVEILDGNGNENYAQVYTYGEEIKLTVAVDGKKAPVEGLTVKYIGSDTTVDGWYRDEVPTDAGVYTVVAVYVEKDGTELKKAGGAVGVLVIEPADAEVGLEDDEYCYDGKEHFAAITNEALDYVTVAIDRKNNIAYVNLPDDIVTHVERIVTMLPEAVETELRGFLAKYENFDGEVQTSTLKAELTAIIDQMMTADMTSEAKALAEKLVEKVAAGLENNQDVDAVIEQLKAELAAMEEAARNEISTELKAALQEYVGALEGMNIDVEQVKAEVKAMVAEIQGQMSEAAAAELSALVDKLAAAVQESVDVSALEEKINKLLGELEALNLDDAKTVVKYVLGAVYSQVDMTEVEALLKQVVAKVEARGYVDYLKNMAKTIAGAYGIDLSEFNALLAKLENKLTSGNIEADDLKDLEAYVDQVLAEMKAVIAQIPDGVTVVFGKNPAEIGKYDCCVMNVSANYKAEFVEATLIIHVHVDVDRDGDHDCDFCDQEGVTNHIPGEAVRENEVAATCKEAGSYDEVVYCKECQTELSRVKKTIDKLTTHTPGEAVRENEVAATCKEAGSYDEVVYCTVCGTELSRDTKTIEKLTTHTPDEAVRENEVAATEETEGSYELVVYCKICGAELSREKKTTPKLDHVHVSGEAVHENEVAATCKEAGSYDEVVYCTVCGTELSRVKKTIEKLTTHTPGEAVRENEVAATEETEGSYDEVIYCTVCGAELSREKKTTPRLGHTHIPGEAVRENEVGATCAKEGSYDEVVYCTVCKAEISRTAKTIDKLTTHTPGETVRENEVAATEETEGSYDEVVYCKVCGAELSREKVTIPATGGGSSSGGDSGAGGSGGSGGSEDESADSDIADPNETGVADYLITDVHNAFMVGDNKGTFRPNANITRAEAAQVFYNLLKNKNVAITVDFDDVDEDAWYAAAVNTLGSMGIVNGVGDNKFEPQRAITRAEFAAIAVRFTKTAQSGFDFDDVPKDHWAYSAISTAAAYGWVNGIGNDLFGPDRSITRAEVAKIVNHMLGRLGDREQIDDGAGRVFPDVTKSHWAWYEIAEATTDHDCKFNKARTEETWKK